MKKQGIIISHNQISTDRLIDNNNKIDAGEKSQNHTAVEKEVLNRNYTF